ncbi:hypothetical protein BT96DRAFT_1024000 [Gymnopus androsaceus JB14]|uniref:Uncharacterized protein n=1 Tax=Gymnopus androsaceus JB14 TaxID=1447944 RepID=A0A6A4H063_9AGAR|nr:hypothetical protein BT96DRAFT_1024000 [Gymnopus androsaceus JB14]
MHVHLSSCSPSLTHNNPISNEDEAHDEWFLRFLTLVFEDVQRHIGGEETTEMDTEGSRIFGLEIGIPAPPLFIQLIHPASYPFLLSSSCTGNELHWASRLEERRVFTWSAITGLHFYFLPSVVSPQHRPRSSLAIYHPQDQDQGQIISLVSDEDYGSSLFDVQESYGYGFHCNCKASAFPRSPSSAVSYTFDARQQYERKRKRGRTLIPIPSLIHRQAPPPLPVHPHPYRSTPQSVTRAMFAALSQTPAPSLCQ